MLGAGRCVEILFGLIGGLGLFLFGMRNMSEGLQKAAGERLKRLLEVLTTNRLMGVIMGAIVTVLVQSSSTTTVMVVGFVNARLMTLAQAVGVIMGANIGTTATAQLIAFELDQYSLPAIGIGAAFFLFSRAEKARFFGQVLMGFGILFLGLEIMKDALRPLREWEYFREMLISFGQNPILGVIAGTVLTVAVQSSSASIGLLQSLASEGLIPIQSALPVLFGDNIGTTITAVLSAIGASLAARRAAAVHVIFNLVGTLLFLLVLPLVLPIVIATSDDVVRQIANAHTIFNVGNTIVQLPLAGLIVWVVLRLLPSKKGEVEIPDGAQHLDERLLGTPSVALDLAHKESLEMAGVARKVVADSVDRLLDGEGGNFDALFDMEKQVNRVNHEISHYLSHLSRRTLSEEQRRTLRELHNIIADIERVGDHGENIAELCVYSSEQKLTFSEKAVTEVRAMAATVVEAFDLALEAWSEADVEKAKAVFELERKVDRMEKEVREGHIDRINRGECVPASGVVFLDLASNLERVADHAANIAALVPGA